jgi:HEAT repeat protein
MSIQHPTEVNTKFDAIVERLQAVDSDDRRWAIYSLEEFEPQMAVDYLIQGLQDEHRAVRGAAAEVLETLPAKVCAKKLIPLLGSVRIEVRNIAAGILVRLGAAAVDDLLPALFDENEDVRKFAADILGQARATEAVAALCKAAREDDVKNVVVSAVEALGKIGSKEALPTLYQIFDDDDSIRLESAEAIGLIGESESALFLQERIQDDNYLVTYAIIDALGNIGDARSLPVLIQTLDQVPATMEEPVCRAILKIGQRNNMNVLTDPDSKLCTTVIACCQDQESDLIELAGYQFTLDPSLPVLERFFENVERFPSALVVSLIHAAKQAPQLTESVCKLVNHPDDWVAYTALESLEHFRVDLVQQPVLEMLQSERGLPIIAAIKTAVNLELKEAIPALEKLSTGDSEDLRGAALSALEQLRG